MYQAMQKELSDRLKDKSMWSTDLPQDHAPFLTLENLQKSGTPKLEFALMDFAKGNLLTLTHIKSAHLR